MKICSKCEIEKPKSEFYRQVRSKDGLASWCKPCRRASEKLRYSVNVAMVHAKQRAYREAHREELIAKKREYHRENRVTINEKRRELHAANPERLNKRNREWQKENLECHRAKNHNRRARKQGNGGTLSPGLRNILLKKQGGRCALCYHMLGDDIHMDHILPLKLGGPNTDNNIQLLHKKCNSRKGAKHPVDYLRSLGLL